MSDPETGEQKLFFDAPCNNINNDVKGIHHTWKYNVTTGANRGLQRLAMSFLQGYVYWEQTENKPKPDNIATDLFWQSYRANRNVWDKPLNRTINAYIDNIVACVGEYIRTEFKRKVTGSR